MPSIITRYGHSQNVVDPNDVWIRQKLLQELRTEQFDEPDDEHTQVSVSNEHWSVTAQVSGLITFDNIDLLEEMPSDLPENMYLRDISDDELVAIWAAVVREDKVALLAYGWKQLEELQPYQREFYRESGKTNAS